jgi:two-component system response regulator AtoC
VRELENTLKSFFVLGDEERFLAKLRNQDINSVSNMTAQHTSPLGINYPISNLPLKEVTKEAARRAETDAILDVLSYTRWNRRKTAALLEISYKALLNKIKEYEIEDRYQELVRGQNAASSQQQI